MTERILFFTGATRKMGEVHNGRANYSMEFFEYQPLPKNIQEEVLEKKPGKQLP